MKVFVCVDDSGGMMFGGRRVSRDRVLIDDVAKDCRNRRLRIHPYSALLFKDADASPTVSEDFLDAAERGDCCFVENVPLAPHAHRIDELVIYRWNRRYPSDRKLDVTPASLGFKLLETVEFAGSSHEKITKETYVK